MINVINEREVKGASWLSLHLGRVNLFHNACKEMTVPAGESHRRRFASDVRRA